MTLEVPISAEVEIMRQKCRDDTITPEELHAILVKLRGNRIAAASSPVRASKSRAIKVDGAALLEDL